MKLPPPETAVEGVYAMRTAAADGEYHGTLVLQGNGVGTIFVSEVLPVLDKEGWNFNIYYVASAELYNLLTPERREAIFPERLTVDSMGITDFTLPTLFRWVRSNEGRLAACTPSAAALPRQRDGGQGAGGGGHSRRGQLAAIRDFGRYTADRIRRKGHGRPA